MPRPGEGALGARPQRVRARRPGGRSPRRQPQRPPFGAGSTPRGLPCGRLHISARLRRQPGQRASGRTTALPNRRPVGAGRTRQAPSRSLPCAGSASWAPGDRTPRLEGARRVFGSSTFARVHSRKASATREESESQRSLRAFGFGARSLWIPIKRQGKQVASSSVAGLTRCIDHVLPGPSDRANSLDCRHHS